MCLVKPIFSRYFRLFRCGPQQIDKLGTQRSACRLFVVWKKCELQACLLGLPPPPSPRRHMLIGTSARPLFVGSSMCVCQVMSIETTFLYHASHNSGCYSFHALECWQSLKAASKLCGLDMAKLTAAYSWL